MALRHPLHVEEWQQVRHPREMDLERGGSRLLQQPHQPCPLHLHQQGREAECRQSLHLQEY